MFGEVDPKKHAAAQQAKSQLTNWVKRAEKVMGKRHELIHSHWGLKADTREPIRATMPLVDAKMQVVKLDELQRMIDDTQELITEIKVELPGLHRLLYP